MAGPVVKISQGTLQGVYLKDIDENQFFGFKGIRYAKSPVGKLRFKDPEPPESWTGVRDGSKYGTSCGQFESFTESVVGSDDCLFLNVFTKSIDPEARRAVMFYIHGGGFIAGEANEKMYDPDFLMKKDIVLVTINYRLGVLGFLNLEDKVAAGNQGLKDTVMALIWVQQNIKTFGGDPENVTIIGESAGGAAVHFLSVSPLAKGLFHKVISQSGVFTRPSAHHRNPRNYALELCERLGQKITDSEKIVEFLQSVSLDELILAQQKLLTSEMKMKNIISLFGPHSDPNSDNPFLPTDLLDALQLGIQYPLMIGYTDHEGWINTLGKPPNFMESLNEHFYEHLHPCVLEILDLYGSSPEDMKRYYFGQDKITADKINKYEEMCTDLFFIQSIHEVVRIQLEKSNAPTYMYCFKYDKGFSYVKHTFKKNVTGAAHVDDLTYLFKMSINNAIYTKDTKDYRLIDQMTELWTNFAKYGRPTPEITELIPLYWLPVIDDKAFRHMAIGEDLQMDYALNIELKLKSMKIKQ